MNTEDMLKTLSELFSSFTFHRLFVKELSDLLKKDLKGKEARFFKILTTQLQNIRTFGRDINKVDNNEQLQNVDGHYYSIHLQQSQFNVRMIVYIFSSGVPYFLCAFNERAGKRRTDYSAYTEVMQRRFKEMSGDD